MVIFAICAGVFLAYCGIAVDVAHIYSCRFRLQNAVNAGAKAGLNDYLIIRNTLSADDALAHAGGVAKDIIKANLYQLGISESDVVTQPLASIVFSSSLPELSVEMTFKIPTFFMRFVGIGSITQGIRGVGKARGAMTYVTMVLDGSITGFQATPDATETQTLGYMKYCAKQFVDYFEDGVDQFAVIRSDGNPGYIFPSTSPFQLTTLNKATVKNAIDALTAQPGNALPEALQMAQVTMSAAPSPASFSTRSVVVFSRNSAPNVFRGKFLSPAAVATPLPTTAPGEYDYRLYMGYDEATGVSRTVLYGGSQPLPTVTPVIPGAPDLINNARDFLSSLTYQNAYSSYNASEYSASSFVMPPSGAADPDPREEPYKAEVRAANKIRELDTSVYAIHFALAPSCTPTDTPTPTPTGTWATPTGSYTTTPTGTSWATPTGTYTATPTGTMWATPTSSGVSPTETLWVTPTGTYTVVPTESIFATPTGTFAEVEAGAPTAVATGMP